MANYRLTYISEIGVTNIIRTLDYRNISDVEVSDNGIITLFRENLEDPVAVIKSYERLDLIEEE